ncbi:hypothetical protein BT67DRAFT_82113 [Trichocladium antarcticum]|uniref:Bromodomain associated domain-containing protein n=1 Tax=Trichocladium antarcticum TaxID=1450529 RepID=A0AAN6ZB60_9PEZI|nr:hypothetical protein BT67DRAFT_82113 [Trichocladium antarcticum]
MTPPLPLSHALLRPAVLQILRATGYHSARTSVIDSVTDLAARYFLHLCHVTALYAAHNNDGDNPEEEEEEEEAWPPSHHAPTTTTTTTTALATIDGNDSGSGSGSAPADAVVVPVPAPTLVDVRMALQRAGALLPERLEEEQRYSGVEDLRGVEGFVAWAVGPMNREIKRIALDGEDEAGDYLDALKKKHSKNDDDSKYLGTLLGRSIEHGDVLVEGGECPSISVWEERRRAAGVKKPGLQQPQLRGGADVNGNGNGNGDGEESRPGSSGLSSLGDRSIADDMDLS